jgi:fructokinase
MQPLWGIDLGGTKVEGIIMVPGSKPETLCRMRLPTGAEKGYRHMTSQIVTLVEQMKKESGLRPERIGMATPGIQDTQTNTMKNCNSVCLNGQPLKADMERLLGVPVVMANDANCFALAETLYGSVQEQMPEARMIYGLIMGTGVGGGLVIDKKVWNGRQGIAGEWGHNVLDPDGAACYCGKKGCVEQVISGPATEQYYQHLTGQRLALKEIAERYALGNDAAAMQTIEHLVTMFGRAISYVVNMLDPDAIVIGGGVGNIDLLYTRGKEELGKYIFNNRVETVFLKPKLGDSAGVFGAAGLVQFDN